VEATYALASNTTNTRCRKSQLAIEHCYRTAEQSPETWVFWAHASNIARLEQSFRNIAEQVKIRGREEPQADVFKLVHDWLRNKQNGQWLLVLDSADDAGVFSPLPNNNQTSSEDNGTHAGTGRGRRSALKQRLSKYLPPSRHGSVLVTSRSRLAANQIVEDSNVILIEPMDDPAAHALLYMKLRDNVDGSDSIAELAAELEYMPLALVHAAAYIHKQGPQYSVRQYLAEYRKIDSEKTSLLNQAAGHLRRDEAVSNAVVRTWQISFDHIRSMLRSAEDYENEDAMSFRDSTYGTMSATGSVQGAISLPGVREEMLDILVTDDSLRQSGQNAIELMSADAFVTLFKNLLRTFSQELRQEAEQKEQRGAAYVFWCHATYAARSACENWRGMKDLGLTELLAKLPEKKMELDHALQQFAPRIEGEYDNDGIIEEWPDSDLEELVFLKRLEYFITNSNAFRNLQHRLRRSTTKNNHEVEQMRTYCRFTFTRSPVTAIQHLCKRAVEHLAGTRLSWWPLSEPEEELKANCTRVYSQPLTSLSRRSRFFYDDIPTSLAEKLFHELSAARSLAPATRLKALRHEAVFLEGTTLMRLLCNRNSELAVFYTSKRTDELTIDRTKSLPRWI
jgi:hypothetical protein